MMPQRSDLSRQSLKEAFARLLLVKSIDQINVREIVNEAQIARSTFYRNFDDKADFLEWLQNDLVAETSGRFIGRWNHEPDFTDFYQYASKNRNFMRAFLTDQRWPQFVDSLQNQALKHYQELLKGAQHEVPDNFLAAFLVGGHVNMFLQWLKSEHPLAPAQMAQYHRRLGENWVLQSLHLFSK